MSTKIVIREGIEFIVEESALRFEVFTPHHSELAPVTVFKPDGTRRAAEVNWIAVGLATPAQAREIGLAVTLGADIADTLNRGIVN